MKGINKSLCLITTLDPFGMVFVFLKSYGFGHTGFPPDNKDMVSELTIGATRHPSFLFIFNYCFNKLAPPQPILLLLE